MPGKEGTRPSKGFLVVSVPQLVHSEENGTDFNGVGHCGRSSSTEPEALTRNRNGMIEYLAVRDRKSKVLWCRLLFGVKNGLQFPKNETLAACHRRKTVSLYRSIVIRRYLMVKQLRQGLCQ